LYLKKMAETLKWSKKAKFFIKLNLCEQQSIRDVAGKSKDAFCRGGI